MLQANNMVIRTAVKHFWKTFPLVDQSQPLIDDGTPNHGKFLPHIITSNLEHDSVKLVLEHLVDERQAGMYLKYSHVIIDVALHGSLQQR